jgi:hypothetical protein
VPFKKKKKRRKKKKKMMMRRRRRRRKLCETVHRMFVDSMKTSDLVSKEGWLIKMRLNQTHKQITYVNFCLKYSLFRLILNMEILYYPLSPFYRSCFSTLI